MRLLAELYPHSQLHIFIHNSLIYDMNNAYSVSCLWFSIFPVVSIFGSLCLRSSLSPDLSVSRSFCLSFFLSPVFHISVCMDAKICLQSHILQSCLLSFLNPYSDCCFILLPCFSSSLFLPLSHYLLFSMLSSLSFSLSLTQD